MSNLIAQALDTEALGGAFWELLIGLILFMPIFRPVIGAAAGTLAGKYAGIGAEDKFIRENGNSIFGANSLMVG